jgi:hypothetical protein
VKRSQPTQRKRKRKRLIAGLVLVTILAIAMLILLGLDHRIEAASACPRHVLERLANNTEPIHPVKVVVDPWQGRHHVYGIFMVPTPQLYRAYAVIRITGSGLYCGGVSHPARQFDDVVASPGHYVIKGFLRTRTSFWLMSKGARSKLADPNNWQLV